MKRFLRQENNSKIKVVIDTNVVISAPLGKDTKPARIFELLILEKIDNYTSKEILDEVKRVFESPKISSLISEEKKDFIIHNFKAFSNAIRPEIRLDVIKEDKADNKFLECALAAKASYIISGDKHLLRLRKFQDVSIVSPKEFLGILGDED